MGRQDFETETLLAVGGFFDVAHALRGEGFDASEDGTGRGTPLVPVAIQAGALLENAYSGPDGVGVRTDGLAYTLEARSEVQAICFSSKDHGADAGDIAPTLRSMSHDGSHAKGGGQVAVVIPIQNQATRHAGTDGSGRQNGKGHGLGVGDPMYTMTGGDQHAVAFDIMQCTSPTYRGQPKALTEPSHSLHVSGSPAIASTMAVRRLTPRECERLMGQDDDYTLVPYRGKMMADGPRYKMLGNSMITHCMRWIGERIEMVRHL